MVSTLPVRFSELRGLFMHKALLLTKHHLRFEEIAGSLLSTCQSRFNILDEKSVQSARKLIHRLV